jgi:glycosyltransferase involved in cell wall biosynthesis
LQFQKYVRPERTLLFVGEKHSFIDKRVIPVGIKRGKDLVAEMQKATVLVLPSILHEAFPMVLIEAMACQTPVIGTDRGGIPEIISDGIDGFLVLPKDSATLALAISKIVADKALATRMGLLGEAKVRERCTWDTRVALTKEVFASCLR